MEINQEWWWRIVVQIINSTFLFSLDLDLVVFDNSVAHPVWVSAVNFATSRVPKNN